MSDMTPLAQAILVYAVMALGVLATLLTGIAQLQAFRGSQGDRAALAGRRGLLAASTGMGSISGALLALEIGGPGAIGWMWIASLLGMGLVYAEVLLAVRHRARAASGRGLEAASTHVLAQVGGRPLALIVVLALVAVCAALVPVFGTLSTDMMIIGGLGVVVLVGLAARDRFAPSAATPDQSFTPTLSSDALGPDTGGEPPRLATPISPTTIPLQPPPRTRPLGESAPTNEESEVPAKRKRRATTDDPRSGFKTGNPYD